MKKRNNTKLTVSILWAAAILSSALLGGPAFLTLLILPILGYMAISQFDEKQSTSCEVSRIKKCC